MNMEMVTSELFDNVICDFWRNEQNDVFMTSRQLGSALGYSDPQKGMDKLIERNAELKNQEFSVTVKMTGNDGRPYNTRVFNEDGIYEIAFLGKTSKAQAFRSWVRKILKSIRKEEYRHSIQAAEVESPKQIFLRSEMEEGVPYYDLNQSWGFKQNPMYISSVLDFPTKDVLLQAVGDIGAIEHEQMVQLFGVQQKHVHSMFSRGELIPHELWLENGKSTVYTLGLYGSKKVGHKPARIEHWSMEDVLEKLVFFEFVKYVQGKEPYPVFTIKADKNPFVGRISYAGEEHRVIVVQKPMSRYELPDDEATAVYMLTAKEVYGKPLQQKYECVIQHNYADFMLSIQKHLSKADPFAFLNDLP
ncbi:hypothetical protein ASL14_19135 [Paenibacillus sp. IHB B 3084]|uniref:BRO-N domain-containing protein n=1 Tax=Paenibacillus sp. IHB B 3084 TaxID=867076 RepID=UPI000721AA9B|nr:Bro-N domain-containing protein [Paenibacillus sp. IHB B 3084]ALP37987.1 hypothetical protein ASL14_19135 [Paenibacillus sp. IHB B 3084]